MKTRNVDKSKYKNYLIKAEEFFDIMNESFNKQEYNAVVLNAIHCAISSADALTVFYKGLRHAGERHEDVISLLNTLDMKNFHNKNRQLLNLLQLQTKTLDEEKLMTESNASDSIKNASRFFNWVKELLKE